MKGISRRLEDIFTEITFAEAGEWEAAAAIMGAKVTDRKTRKAGRPKDTISGLCAGRA